MKEFDLNKLKIASIYLSRMADGRNPANNESVQNEVLDNPNVIRCLHFVCDVLEEVRANHGLVGKKYQAVKKEFPLEVLDQYTYRHDKPISQVLKQFQEPLEGQGYRKLNATPINKWLGANGYIEKRLIQESNRECWFPLQKGLDAGMYSEERGDPGFQYAVVMYNEKGQRFLADHMGQILQDIQDSKKAKNSDIPPFSEIQRQ